jgi:serine/threonine protein kinase
LEPKGVEQLNTVYIALVAVGLPLLFVLCCYCAKQIRDKRRNNRNERIVLREQLLERHDLERDLERDQTTQRLLAAAHNPLEQDQFLIPPDDLHIGPRIGAGGCGLIYKATLGANTAVAAKEIITALMNPKDIKEFEQEARMLTQMNHPHVLRVLGFCTITAENSSDDMEHKYIVTEFAPNGSLEQAIQDAINAAKMIKETDSDESLMPFTKIEALEWAVQIASGMAFVHGRGFVHRDLKPHNILLNKSFDALVADLGTTRHSGTGKNAAGTPSLSKDDEATRIKAMEKYSNGEDGVSVLLKHQYNDAMTYQMGTPMYMAKEQHSASYSYPIDVWAFGLMLIRLFTLKLPYPKEYCTMHQLLVGVRSGALIPISVNEEDVPDGDILNVIHACLEQIPSKRLTFKMIEKRLSEAFKRCCDEEIRNENSDKETKSNEYTSVDGTVFTHPSVR